MGARKKLNSAYAFGSVILAAIVGTLSASWAAFCVALGLLLFANWYEGDIRFRGRK